MNFLKSLWPANSPAHLAGREEILILRERILQTLLLATSVLGVGIYYFLLQNALKTNIIAVLVLSAILGVLIYLTSARKMAYLARALAFSTLLSMMGAAAVFQFGNSGAGFLLIITSIIVTTILLGPLAGLAATAVGFAASLIISSGIEEGRFILTPEYVNPNTGLGWSRSGAIFVLTVGIIIPSISFIMVGLQRSLRQSVALAKDLQAQRDLLSVTVQEQTSSLERRLNEIRITTEIVRSFSSMLRTDELFQYVVELIRERLDLYYVGLFLVDAPRQYAELKAGTGEAGRVMLAARHRLPIGGVSMIGWCVANAKSRIALDVGEEGMHFNNPNLPQTRSELALPILSRGEALGALTIQSAAQSAFDEDDIAILQGIADSLGVALQNARLFEQSQRDLTEISSLNRQYVRQSWADEISAEGELAYTYESSVAQSGSLGGHKISIPVRLRGQVIGQIEVEKDEATFSGEEIDLVESISSQTAVALESARLLQESQRKAAQDEKIVELTSQFSRAFNMDDVLQMAVKELGQIPSITEVSIQLTRPDSGGPPPAIPSKNNGRGGSAQ